VSDPIGGYGGVGQSGSNGTTSAAASGQPPKRPKRPLGAVITSGTAVLTFVALRRFGSKRSDGAPAAEVVVRIVREDR
jgi:hypothetical protein